MTEARTAERVRTDCGARPHQERASSGRAECRSCHATIDKGAWRIPLVFYEEGRFSAAGFLHVPCSAAYFESADVLPRINHFAPGLGEDDRKEIEALLTAPQA